MATFHDDIWGVDKQYKVCPYNRNHRVPANRFVYHLIKCEKKSKEQLIMCPFNGKHRVTKELFDLHMSNCPDLYVMTNANNGIENGVLVSEPNKPIEVPINVTKKCQQSDANDGKDDNEEESWD
ncbi:gametocyte-specific factor 1-like [Oppia nitens]|uniref:gametocyte-specific factor 1-like n=1 Tax=Oppia nitens TaxID=1686743 RepID=UPI0023DAB62A|nr:gametocyte-specific factor 1-like [Oppia nitens]